jgi:hypothetical protein
MKPKLDEVLIFPKTIEDALAQLIKWGGVTFHDRGFAAYFSVGLCGEITRDNFDSPKPLFVCAIGRAHVLTNALGNFREVFTIFDKTHLRGYPKETSITFLTNSIKIAFTDELFLVFNGLWGNEEQKAAEAILLYLAWQHDLVELDCTKPDSEIEQEFFKKFGINGHEYFAILGKKPKHFSLEEEMKELDQLPPGGVKV